MRADRVAAGVVRATVGYMPDTIDKLSNEQVPDIVFYSGFIIPVQTEERQTHDGFSVLNLCPLKLVRPEYQGIVGIGSANGDLNVLDLSEGNDDGFKLIRLDAPSPASCPALDKSWLPTKRRGQQVIAETSLARRNESGIRDFDTNLLTIPLFPKTEFDSKVDEILHLTYNGYVF